MSEQRMLDYAKRMRTAATDAETMLWRHLRGKRFVDFACFECKLVIEADGGQHGDAIAYDAQRTAWLEAQGFRVLRFWNNDVLLQTEAVLESTLRALEGRKG